MSGAMGGAMGGAVGLSQINKERLYQDPTTQPHQLPILIRHLFSHAISLVFHAISLVSHAISLVSHTISLFSHAVISPFSHAIILIFLTPPLSSLKPSLSSLTPSIASRTSSHLTWSPSGGGSAAVLLYLVCSCYGWSPHYCTSVCIETCPIAHITHF